MPKIKIDTNRLNDLSTKIRNIKNKTNECQAAVGTVINRLDWEVSSKASINSRLNKVQKRLQYQTELMDAYIRVLRNVSDGFSNKDGDIKRKSKEIVYNMGIISFMLEQVGIGKYKGPQVKDFGKLEKMVDLFGRYGCIINKPMPPYSWEITSLGILKNIIENGIDNNKKDRVEKSVWNYQFGNDVENFKLSILGYEKGEDETSAYFAKLSGESNSEVVGVDVKTTSSVTIGAVHGKASLSFDPFEGKIESEGRKGSSYNSNDGFKHTDGSVSKETSKDFMNLGVKAEAGFSVAEIKHKTTIGNDIHGASVGGEVRLLNADVGATAGIKINEDGVSVKVKGEAGISLAAVEGSTTIKVAGVETKTTVTAETGFGVYGECSYTKEDGLTIGFGGSFIVGGKIKLKIKLPKLW